MIAPCKECTERHYKCHAECTRYKNWKTEQRKIKDYLNDQKKDEHYLNELAYYERRDRRSFKDGKSPKFRKRI